MISGVSANVQWLSWLFFFSLDLAVVCIHHKTDGCPRRATWDGANTFLQWQNIIISHPMGTRTVVQPRRLSSVRFIGEWLRSLRRPLTDIVIFSRCMLPEGGNQSASKELLWETWCGAVTRSDRALGMWALGSKTNTRQRHTLNSPFLLWLGLV